MKTPTLNYYLKSVKIAEKEVKNNNDYVNIKTKNSDFFLIQTVSMM